MKNLTNSKGELTTSQIVTIVILIMSFVVILFFIYQLGFKETSQKEICKNSVELKAKDILGVSSLNCHSEYFCLTRGEKCSEDTSVKVIKTNKDEETAKDIGNAMSDCWWQYGGGRLNFVDWGFLNRVTPSDHKQCGICSQVYMNGVKVDKTDVIKQISSQQDLTSLKNSLVIPNDFNFDKSFVIIYSVEQERKEQMVEINYLDNIKDLKCERFFNLA